MTLTLEPPQAGAGAPAAASPAWRAGGWLRDLGPAFYSDVAPSRLPGLHWVARNQALADALCLGPWLQTDDALQLLGGNALPPGPQPLASVYSGHQFGQWAGQLGDGRALLLGEIDTPEGRMELQLKGASDCAMHRQSNL